MNTNSPRDLDAKNSTPEGENITDGTRDKIVSITVSSEEEALEDEKLAYDEIEGLSEDARMLAYILIEKHPKSYVLECVEAYEGLSDGGKKVMMKYAERGLHPSVGLREAGYYEQIQNLSGGGKNVGNKLMEEGNVPTVALLGGIRHEKMQSLSEDGRNVADEYIKNGLDWMALEQAEAFEKIKKLPKDAKQVADEYLKKGNNHSEALKQAEAFMGIQGLSEEEKAIADRAMSIELSPMEALEEVSAYREIKRSDEWLRYYAEIYMGRGHLPKQSLGNAKFFIKNNPYWHERN